jgi:hypothetical protein
MINALTPKAPGSTATPSEMKPLADLERERQGPADDLWRTPKPEWTRGQYQFALIQTINADDAAGIENINREFLKTEEASRPDSKERWEAFGEYVRLVDGKGGSLVKLKALAAAHPDSSGALEYLAMGFAQYGSHTEAAKTYEAAGNKATDDREALRLMGRAALEYAHAGTKTAAWATVSAMKPKPEMSNDEMRLIRVLKELAEIEKDEELMLALMERIIEVNPDDAGTRFSLAYKHSQRGHSDLPCFII